MALIPALIQLAMSGRGGRGGGGGGGRGYGGRGYGGRGRQPFDAQADLDKKAGQYFHGGGRNPFSPTTSYSGQDQDEWDYIFKSLGGEIPYPKQKIDQDIYEPEEEE